MIGTKTVRRGMAVVAAAAVLALPMGLPAQAEPDYPPSFYKISAEAFNAKVGQSLKFTAQTFKSGSTVAVDVSVGDDAVSSKSATANSKGVASTSVKFTTVGVNTVTMSGTSDQGDPLSLSADVTVTAAGDGDTTPVSDDNSGSGSDDSTSGGSNAGGVPFFGGGLPRTGAQIAATALIAAALVGLGALLVVFTRRRRTS
ncbi:MAG TPA: LPXTG cell wall anchor domain-containing protein [Actinomycetes bacterium]|nr:LPXTG cell wall anchor domain-containing protein [Actinomycetes bacterium]